MLMGILDMPWWGYVLATLAVTHITIVAVTVYLHRHSAHRALDLHPIASHFFRCWLWLTTGMVTKEWTAIHRKHHARVETAEDPHSPMIVGIRKVLWQGTELYRAESKNLETMEKYGHGTPDDWIERNLYTRFSWQGVAVLMVINLILFGPIGLTIWAIQMAWIPFFAAGVINGIGHYWGYRNYACEDTSTEHRPARHPDRRRRVAQQPSRLRHFGQVLREMVRVRHRLGLHPDHAGAGLAEVRRVAPKLKMEAGKLTPDLETLQAVITHRYAVLTNYAGR
jgi:stearoyl-CoA desaturase (delta-9 desaturase)